jgi:nucleotide-binding universal stress UspA family protein
MKTILAPIDFSAASKPVVAEAQKLAKFAGARLVLLHVVQPPVMTDSDAGAQMSADYAATASESAVKTLTALKKSLRARGGVAETRHLIGFPGQCILDQAVTLGANYIVLGSHGHGAFYDLIVGSTTSRVLKQARCPVLVVPPKKAAARK